MAGLHSEPRAELEPAAERTGKIDNIANTIMRREERSTNERFAQMNHPFLR
jgi:hypothetical protein